MQNKMQSRPGVLIFDGVESTCPIDALKLLPKPLELEPREYRNEHHRWAVERMAARGGLTEAGLNRLRAYHWYEAFMKPLPKEVRALCWRAGGRPAPHRVAAYWSEPSLFEEYVADGNVHLLPLLFWCPLNTQHMRRLFGKGLWRKLCANTSHRNTLLVAHLPRLERPIAHNSYYLLATPSAVLKATAGRYLEHPSIVFPWLTKHCKGRYGDKRYIRDIAGYVDDTVRMCGARVLHWDATRLREEHDRASRLEDRGEFIEFGWMSSLQPVVIGEVLYTPLKDSFALWEEGKRMRHCVASYKGRCASQGYLVYSTESSTIGLFARGGRLAIDQEMGPRNTTPEPAVGPQLLEYLLAGDFIEVTTSFSSKDGAQNVPSYMKVKERPLTLTF